MSTQFPKKSFFNNFIASLKVYQKVYFFQMIFDKMLSLDLNLKIPKKCSEEVSDHANFEKKNRLKGIDKNQSSKSIESSVSM